MSRLVMGVVIVVAAVGLVLVAMYVVAEIKDEPTSPALNPGAQIEDVDRETGTDQSVTDVPGITMPASVGRTVTAYGVTVRPLEVTEDSRCPAGVTCTWAGTVRVRTQISGSPGTYEQVLTLGETLTTESSRIILTGVEPLPVEGQQISQDAYRFSVRIERR
jgi:hypothetical protein